MWPVRHLQPHPSASSLTNDQHRQCTLLPNGRPREPPRCLRTNKAKNKLGPSTAEPYNRTLQIQKAQKVLQPNQHATNPPILPPQPTLVLYPHATPFPVTNDHNPTRSATGPSNSTYPSHIRPFQLPRPAWFCNSIRHSQTGRSRNLDPGGERGQSGGGSSRGRLDEWEGRGLESGRLESLECWGCWCTGWERIV